MARPRKGTKNIDGQWIFSDFSKGLYLLDTPRNITEQLYSLAMTGGRNCWAEKGALVNQYGYLEIGQLPEDDPVIAYTRIAAGNNDFFIITLQGKVYLYTANEGLKAYKTGLTISGTPITARRAKDLIISSAGNHSIFGAYYKIAEPVEILTVAADQMFKYTAYWEFHTTEDNYKYFWTNKSIAVNGDEFYVISATQSKEEKKAGTCTIRIYPADSTKTYEGPYIVAEKTRQEVSFVFKPENTEPDTGGTITPKPNVTINPALMEVSQNRLFIQDTNGTIFYTALGLVGIDSEVQQLNINFDESAGAGYFKGFYNDTSQTLAIEDFLSGTLIIKESGFYFLTITQATSATGSAIYTVNIEKISNCGQKYASDHVIVREKVYAFDTNTGAIVNAISVNVFGSMVAGKPIVSAEYVNAQNSGINDSKRYLTYNAESEVFILYYGENLNNGLILTAAGTLFPRQLDKQLIGYLGFNQGVAGITRDCKIIQDFKKSSIVPNLSSIVEFEPIGLRSNRLACATILEVTELNEISYNLSTSNAGSSYQKITPSTDASTRGVILPPMLYSDKEKQLIYDSFSMETKWADKKSNVTRISAPMSGREGISLTFEFPANTAFCLSALRLPDFSQGE